MSTMTPTASTLSSVSSTDPTTLLLLARDHAETYMSQPHYDASHDWTHVQRVVTLAQHILSIEQGLGHDPLLVELAALLHDVGDHKYAAPGTDPTTEVQRLLAELGAESSLSHSVQDIVNCVSYSHEVKNPTKVREVLAKHPELGIVQDADRLDAIGAVGIARLFTFGGAKGRSLSGTMDHIDEKLLKLEGMMKTAEGKRLARKRTERLEVLKQWWLEETSGSAERYESA